MNLVSFLSASYASLSLCLTNPQSYYNNIEGAFNLKVLFIYETTPSYLKSYLMQVTSMVLKLQLL